MSEIEKIVIIGSGPAGHSAAIYAGRANLRPLMYEGFMAGGVAAGGQLTTTTDVENYAGFPEGISGPELMERMRKQSLACGARIVTETVDRVDLKSQPYRIFVGDKSVETHTLIISTGAIAKRLHVPNEERLWQKGISACAVCDGALPIFRDQVLVVIGGGDSACEEASYLTKFGKKVFLCVRRDKMRASKIMQQRVLDNPKIQLEWNTTLVDVLGKDKVEGVELRDPKTDELRKMEAGGLFYAIGHTPNTTFLDGQIKMDDDGYIITETGSTRTSIPGAFACGDVQDKKYRQAITSAGTGCMAALDAEAYLGERGLST